MAAIRAMLALSAVRAVGSAGAARTLAGTAAKAAAVRGWTTTMSAGLNGGARRGLSTDEAVGGKKNPSTWEGEQGGKGEGRGKG